MCALMPRSELISTPKIRSVVTRTALVSVITLRRALLNDDKLSGPLNVQPQIIRPGPVRDVIKLLRCRTVRRRHGVSGGAPVNFGRRRRAAGTKDRRRRDAARAANRIFFQRFPNKFLSILKIF